ncbi:MAG: hypothetical protein CL920_39530 [Deltaproteobacteria bacterium]|nr:hypothetical protein [Deltaproteobacteria bacterium]MBU54827.1 hypothetical protein [Deltaproteobacteria bacterium]
MEGECGKGGVRSRQQSKRPLTFRLKNRIPKSIYRRLEPDVTLPDNDGTLFALCASTRNKLFVCPGDVSLNI